MRMMYQLMHFFTDNLARLPISQDAQKCRIHEGAHPLVIQTVNTLGDRIEQALQIRLRVLQGALRQLSLSDVTTRAVNPAIGQQHRIQFHRNLAAVFFDQTNFHDMAFIIRQYFPDSLPVYSLQVFRHQIEYRHVIQIFTAMPQQLEHTVVDIGDLSIPLEDKYCIRRVFQSHAQLHFAFTQGLRHLAGSLFSICLQLQVFLFQRFQRPAILLRHAPVVQTGKNTAAEPEQRRHRNQHGHNARFYPGDA